MIIALTILALLVTGIFCCVFFFPFYLEIDTTKNLYRIRLYHFGYVRFLPENDTVLMEFNILTWRKQVDLLAAKQKSSPEKRPVKRKTTKKNVRPGISLKQIIAVLKSFKINRCSVSIDTGNHQLNAFLYPLFYLIHLKTNKSMQINFIHNNELILELENSLARMSRAYMSS